MIDSVIVYIAVNNLNHKIYIGITSCTIDKRRREHLCASRKNTPKYKFHRAIKKYGEKHFSFHELISCNTVDAAKFIECKLISILHPEYNITAGGEGINGYRHTDEEKKRMSKRYIGNKNMLGKKHSEEAKEKMRQAKLKNPTKYWLGKNRTEETIQKIINTKRGIA